MPSKSPARRLLDIVENAAFIASYIDGLDEKAFRGDRMRRDAVERCLQRISEAAVKLGGDAEMLLPSQPWKQIRSLGNVISVRHGPQSRIDGCGVARWAPFQGARRRARPAFERRDHVSMPISRRQTSALTRRGELAEAHRNIARNSPPRNASQFPAVALNVVALGLGN